MYLKMAEAEPEVPRFGSQESSEDAGTLCRKRDIFAYCVLYY